MIITKVVRNKNATIEYLITKEGISKIDTNSKKEVGKFRKFAINFEKFKYSLYPNMPGGQFYRPFKGFKYFTIENQKIILWDKFYKIGFVIVPNNNLNKIESIIKKYVSKKAISE